MAIGEFDPDLTSYSGSVGSEVTHVTVIQSTTESSRFASRVLPPDSQPNVAGHQVALQHGANLVSVILMARFHNDAVTSETYDVIVTRAGSPSGTPTPTVSVYGLSDAIEGYTMPFILARSGDTSRSLTVTANVSETGGDMAPQASEGSSDVVFPAGSASARVEVPTVADQDWEEHSTVTVAVVAGTGYELSPESGSASSTVKDNDVPAVTAAFTVDTSQPQEGDVVTATVTVTTDGPKQPHSSLGNLEFSVDLGSAQQADLHIPFGSNYRNFPAGHRITGGHSYGGGDDVNSASFHVNQQAMQPVASDGVITHYQYQFSVPILIVDDERAEADETFDISVEWDSYSMGIIRTMDRGVTSRTVTIQEHDDTPSAPDPVSYITVAIANSGTAGSTYTVSWHDTEECVGSRKYEVYLTSLRSSGWTSLSKLGETASTNTQLTVSKDNFPFSGQRNLRVYCGDMGRTVGEVPLPSATENSVERPVPGTYSSQPALTSLTVSPGTLGPAFSNYGFLYSVLDVPDSSSQITMNATARDGYTISWDPSDDADANTDGHQVDLAEGYNSIFVSADHDLGVNSFTYEVIVKRAGPTVQQEQENSPATGRPAISGTVQVGETLTADTSGIADADGLTNATFSYQWLSSRDTEIGGATSSTYTLQPSDEGKAIRVQVSFTDDAGNGETLTSAATDAVAAAPTPNTPATGAPTISGTAQVGETLTADTSAIGDADGLTNVTYGYQWLSSRDTEIGGATSSTYTLQASDASKIVKVRVTFTDDAGNDETLTSGATDAVAAPAQADSEDEPSELSYLTVVVTEDDSDHDNVVSTFTTTWNDAEDCSASYNAYLDGVVGDPIHLGSAASEGEQIAASLTNVSAETIGFDAKLYCGTIDSGRLVDKLSIPEYNRSFDTVPISWTYPPKPGNYSTEPGLTALTVSSGTLTPAFHSHALNYTVPDVANADRRITLNTTVKTDYTVAFIPGDLDAYYFVCSFRGWQTALGYQDDTGNPLYPLTDADADTPGFQMELDEGENVFAIHVKPNCENGHLYKLTVTRAANAPANTPATGAPTISGAAQVGETLTTSTSGIADADGLSGATFSYQWLSSRDTEIQGATGAAYILVPGDAGKTIKVRVTFTDDEGNAETLTSAATGAVAPRPNSPATGTPAIGGTAQVGETLAAETSGINDDDGLENVSFSYQWLSSRDTEIQGATDRTYTLAATELGKTIQVRVTFTDDADNDETLTSEATGAVAATVPSAPQSMTVTSGSQIQELDVSWQAPSSDGGSDVTGYKVQWKEAVDSWETESDVSEATVTGTTHTITGLTEDVQYAVRVVAVNDVGEGQPSYEATGTPISGPDLTVGSPTVSNTNPTESGSFTLSATVSNAGDGASAATTLRYYQSTDATISSADTEVGTDAVGELAAGGTSPGGSPGGNWQGLYAPSPAGTYYYGACVDSVTGESDTTNNCSASVTVEVETTTTFPDLEVGQPTVINSTQVAGGLFRLTTTVTNIGDRGSAATTLRYYQSTDATISSADTEVGTDGIRPLGRTAFTSADVTAPLTAGTYYYGACVDAVPVESDTTNNCSSSVTVEVEEATTSADLQVGRPTVTPSTTVAGGSFTLSATVSNTGTGASEATTLRYYLWNYQLTDGTISNPKSQVGTDEVGTLAASETSAESISLTAPSAAGMYSYGVCVDVVPLESDTTNNCSGVLVTVQSNSAATGAPTISGTAQVGQTLTASTSGISDADGLTNPGFSYQWISVDGTTDTAIQGATNSTYILAEADEGKAIKVRVSFTDDAGNDETLTSEPTDAVSAAPPPPPDNVRAATQESGAVKLTWDAPDDATVTGYRIDRRSAANPSDQQRSAGGPRDNHTLVEDTGSADTSYTDQSAEKGVEYEYRVSARNEAGAGEGSDWVRAGLEPVLGDGPPGAPRNLTVAAGDRELTLSWEPPEDNGNPPATRYRIERRMDGKDYNQSHWGIARKTTYTKTHLANGVTYIFRVKAENGSGNDYGPYGPPSEEVSATPTSGSAVDLATPVLSNTKTLHHGMVQLDWEDIEDAGWYVVQYYHVNSGEWLDLPAAGVDIAFHGSSAVVSNLHGLSWLRVRAVSCAGESEWSQIEQLFGTKASDWEDVPVPEVEEGDQIDPCPVILGTPVLSGPETLHHGMVRLDWQDIEDAGWYVVQYYHVKSGEWLDLPTAGVDIVFHGSSAVVSNLHGLSWLRVRAMSCAGESEWSQIEQLFGTKASDWEDVPVPEVAEGDEIEVCPEDGDTTDNSPATGAPTIDGTVQVGETLTAGTSGVVDADGLSNVQYDYQWLADDAEIAGATGSTYTQVAEDEGKAIKVRVSFTDDAGNEETLTSAATDAVAATPASNSPATGAPAISGTAQVGETLTANTSGVVDADGLENVTFSYQWLAGDTAIQGEIGSSYTLQAADEGKTVKVQVSFTDDANNQETLTSGATAAVEAATQPNNPAIGAPTRGYVTVVIASGDDTVSWSDPDGCSSDYNIYKAITPSGDDSETSHIHLGSAASGSTQATLAISHSGDDGYPGVEVELYCGTYDAASSQNLLISSAQLSIKSTSLLGINIREGTYSSAPLTALTISSGTLSPDFDRGLGRYSAEVPSDVEVITLDPTVLTGYQTDFIKNPGSYTVTVCPSPRRVSCVYSYGDGTTTGIVLSDADTDTEGFQINLDRGENRLGIGVHKGPVAAGASKKYSLTVTRAANTPATGQPTISGTAQVGRTLTADTSGIADADGLTNATFSYQWLSSRDTEIGGATSSTYMLQASDASKTVKVRVSFTDEAGNEESVTSAATAAVVAAPPPNSPATGAPTISGTARGGRDADGGCFRHRRRRRTGERVVQLPVAGRRRRNRRSYQLDLHPGSSRRGQGYQGKGVLH